jgi:hypothetical protein
VTFGIVGELREIETIAQSARIREVARLRKRYRARWWSKKKAIAFVRLANGKVRRAEVHWYEAHGIGRVEMKIKELLP